MIDETEEPRSGIEQNYEYGQGTAEVAWAAKEEDVTGLNMANLPIYRAVLNAADMKAEEFALIRRQGFGGSDAAVLIGANPYTKTYMEVHGRDGITEPLVVQKARLILTESEKAVGTLAAVRKGNELESLIMKKAQAALGVLVQKPVHLYRFKQYPYLTMNFDGVGTFMKPKKQTIDPQEYQEEIPGQPIENPEVKYPAPDFSWLGKHHGYAPVEIKVATFKGQKNYNPSKAVYSEQRLFMGLNPWISAPEPLTDVQLRSMSVEEKAAYFGIPIYYYPQLQQEMMAVDANGGFLAVMFDTDWIMHILYVQKDPIVQNMIIIEGLKAARAVNEIVKKEGREPIMALTPEMDKTMNRAGITASAQEAAANPNLDLIPRKEIDPKWKE